MFNWVDFVTPTRMGDQSWSSSFNGLFDVQYGPGQQVLRSLYIPGVDYSEGHTESVGDSPSRVVGSNEHSISFNRVFVEFHLDPGNYTIRAWIRNVDDNSKYIYGPVSHITVE